MMNLGNIAFPLAPISEQQEIIACLDKKCAETMHSLLRSRNHRDHAEIQKSLIYEYVTGKKRVAR